MRRKDREVTDFNEIINIIDECCVVRLGLSNGDFPYIVPVNFAYVVKNGRISLYIHGAMAGRKYELLSVNPLCSFEMDVPIRIECIEAAGDVTMRYKSVMGTARAGLLDGDEKQSAIDDIIMARYPETRNFNYNRAAVVRTAVFKLDVLSVTAKANPKNSGPDI